MCDTSAACRSAGILPETLNKFVRAGWFEMPTNRVDGWLVWSEHDQERLNELVAQGRNPSPNPLPQIDSTAFNAQVRFSLPTPEPKPKKERAPKPKPEPKPKKLREPKPKKERTVRTVTYEGHPYTITELAQHLGMHRQSLSKKLRKCGWDVGKALAPKPKAERTAKPPQPKVRNAPKPVIHEGVEYRSMAALAKHLGIERRTLSYRLNSGIAPEQATSSTKSKPGTKPRQFQFQGQQVTITQLCERFGLAPNTAAARLQRHNFNAEQAFADKLQQHH